MTTMTAIITNPDHTLSVATVERPTPGPTEVLIKNAAAGINPVDWKIRANGDEARGAEVWWAPANSTHQDSGRLNSVST